MFSRIVLIALWGLVILTSPAYSQTAPRGNQQGWLNTEDILSGEKAPSQALSQAEPGRAPALLFHTIEGVAGGTITPTAYLSNPPAQGTALGGPSVSYTYFHFGSKSIQTFAVSETLFRHIEVGYALSRFDMGSLPHEIRKTMAIDIDRNSVYLHHLNLRAMFVEEDSFDLPLPAITAGAHFKYNDGIRSIENRMGGTLSAIGFERNNGVDFVITASKTFPELFFGRKLMASLGVRTSQAAQLGYLGFSDDWKTTLEANVFCSLADWLTVGYEFRQKTNPYTHLDGVFGQEHDWHAVSLDWIIDEHLSFRAAWVYLGTFANSDNSNGAALQLNYAF